jgi:hypothetical protein
MNTGTVLCSRKITFQKDSFAKMRGIGGLLALEF